MVRKPAAEDSMWPAHILLAVSWPQLKVCPEQLKLLCAVWPQSHLPSVALASGGRSELCMVRYM